MPATSRFITQTVVGLVIALAITPAQAQTRRKLDRVLDSIVQKRDAAADKAKHRVILRTKAGYRDLVRQQLASQGVWIHADHPSIDAMTLELDPAAIDRLCGTSVVESCAAD